MIRLRCRWDERTAAMAEELADRRRTRKKKSLSYVVSWLILSAHVSSDG